MNNIQKIFLICGIINVVATILFYIDTNKFVLTENGYRKSNPEAMASTDYRIIQNELTNPTGEYVNTGYSIEWGTAIPFHLLILSGIGFFLFKNKKTNK